MDTKADSPTAMSKLQATIWFWSVVLAYATIWVLIPSTLHTGYRGDVIEMLTVGHQWVWSAKNHPSLPGWIAEILNVLTCRSFAVPFIATQLCTILTLWSVWQLGRIVLDERLALLGAFSVLPYSFFAIKPVWYNHNNVLIAFWCLSIYLVFQALHTNKKRYWIGAGIALGLGFHAKYPVILLVVSILAYMFTRQEGRRYFRTLGPYLTTVVAFAIFLPHIIWLFYHDFPTLSHLTKLPSVPRWFALLHFTGGQLLYLILTLIVVTPIIGLAWNWKIQRYEQCAAKECEKFLFYCFMIPLVCHLLFCGIKGVELIMAYGAAFWGFFGLWLLLRFQKTVTPQHWKLAVTLPITMVLLIAIGFTLLFYSGNKNPNLSRPSKELGTTCEQLWHSRFPDVNCPYISGDDFILTAHVAHFMPVRPIVIMGWGTWASNDDLNQKGGMIVWERDDDENNLPESLRQRFPNAEVLPEAPDLPYKVGRETRMLKIGIAIVPPSP